MLVKKTVIVVMMMIIMVHDGDDLNSEAVLRFSSNED